MKPLLSCSNPRKKMSAESKTSARLEKNHREWRKGKKKLDISVGTFVPTP
jgi:hypothetical protein